MEQSKERQRGLIDFDRILGAGAFVAMAMILFAMLGICAHVGMRYAAGKPLNWVIDVSSILLLYITFLAAAWVLRSEGHVSVDFIFAFLKPRHQYTLQVVNSVFCALSCLVITYFGIVETLSVWRLDLYVDMSLEPLKWLVIVIIPLGSILLCIQFIRRTRRFLKKLADVET